jgi:uncharacterized membrane protein
MVRERMPLSPGALAVATLLIALIVVLEVFVRPGAGAWIAAAVWVSGAVILVGVWVLAPSVRSLAGLYQLLVFCVALSGIYLLEATGRSKPVVEWVLRGIAVVSVIWALWEQRRSERSEETKV